ncbi:MAG: hypothetical protein WDW38_005651 [Sanguina aurantia]
MYWAAMEELAAGHQIPLPAPHPKFSQQDLARIALNGPSFRDTVVEHAEMIDVSDPQLPHQPQDATTAAIFNYIPLSVLGDYSTAKEPNWLKVPQLNFFEFYQGLRERNWTSPHFGASSPPWQLQFFQCGYSGDISGWSGWRALVTKPGGVVAWVDMPSEGNPSLAYDNAILEPTALGFRQVFQQMSQAYTQRLPAEAVAEYNANPFTSRIQQRYSYDCPGEALLRHSYHIAGSPEVDPVTAFVQRPTWEAGVEGVRAAVMRSGVKELQAMRDEAVALIAPNLPTLAFDAPSLGLGPLYFIVCLTLGIVVPAARRGRWVWHGMGCREFLKDPKMFSKLGAKPPKGILMEGDPGTGKTLLAKALAGEAMVPFYQMTGTEFSEGIVGVGAARVRDLFKRARAMAPCVIFVDEIDALGLKRSDGGGRRESPASCPGPLPTRDQKPNEEREQTLNQLLTEMDGFTPDTGVIFLAATNRADLLDPALMRPGRFDRKFRMPKPDTEGRFEILQLHLRGKDVAPDVDLMQLSRDLPGLVGADLANIVNEAQLVAVRQGRTQMSVKDVYAGVDRFTQGEKRSALPSNYKLPILLFGSKEVGIALVATVVRELRGHIEAVERVSIQPKGRSYSRTLFARGTDEDYHMMTRGKLMDRIRVALAGGIAVRITVGEETNQTLPDIKRAYHMASKLVFYYGMSDFGITMWANQPWSGDFSVGSSRPRRVVSADAMDMYADWPTKSEDFRFDPQRPSDVTWMRYKDAVHRVMKECYEEVFEMVESRKEALLAGVQRHSCRTSSRVLVTFERHPKMLRCDVSVGCRHVCMSACSGEQALCLREKEVMGGDLRDVFDLHPAKKVTSPLKLDEMVFNSEGRQSRWPYGVAWLDDSFPIPYWVRKQQEADAAAAAGGSSATGKRDPVAV